MSSEKQAPAPARVRLACRVARPQPAPTAPTPAPPRPACSVAYRPPPVINRPVVPPGVVRTACSVAVTPTPITRPNITRLACKVAPRPHPVAPVIPPGTTTTPLPVGASMVVTDKRHPHPLTLVNRPYGATGYNCDGCGVGDLGAAYHCTTGGCDFDLHPKCVQSDKKDDADCKCYISIPTLLDAAVVALKFQMQVGKHPEFANAEYLIQCRSMYFRFLQLYAKLKKTHPKVVMIPTMGIDVWWQAHLIRPRAYAQFCLDNFGVILDRDMVASDPSKPTIATAALWKHEYKTDYVDPSPAASLVNIDESKQTAEQKQAALTALVTSLVEREAKGELKVLDEGVVSLDNMIAVSAVVEDREWVPNLLTYSKLDEKAVQGADFLNEALDHYKKFLAMSDKHPELMAAFVPPYPIDLLWHTHMQHPVAYSEDSKKFAQGKLLDHTPWPRVTGAEEELRHVMCNVLWSQVYVGESVWKTHSG